MTSQDPGPEVPELTPATERPLVMGPAMEAAAFGSREGPGVGETWL